MTVLISSHILPEIEMTCDRVLIINQGRVVAQGTPADLRREILGQSIYQLQVAGDISALPALLTRSKPRSTSRSKASPTPTAFARSRSRPRATTSLARSCCAGCSRKISASARSTACKPTLEDVFLAGHAPQLGTLSPRQARGEMTEKRRRRDCTVLD